MALLHRDRTDHDRTDDATTTHDTVVGPAATTTPRPAWPDRSDREPSERVVHKASVAHTIRVMLATVLLVAVVAVAAANTERVDVDLLFENYEAPLAALVGGAAGAAFLAGLLLGWRRKH